MSAISLDKHQKRIFSECKLSKADEADLAKLLLPSGSQQAHHYGYLIRLYASIEPQQRREFVESNRHTLAAMLFAVEQLRREGFTIETTHKDSIAEERSFILPEGVGGQIKGCAAELLRQVGSYERLPYDVSRYVDQLRGDQIWHPNASWSLVFDFMAEAAKGGLDSKLKVATQLLKHANVIPREFFPHVGELQAALMVNGDKKLEELNRQLSAEIGARKNVRRHGVLCAFAT